MRGAQALDTASDRFDDEGAVVGGRPGERHRRALGDRPVVEGIGRRCAEDRGDGSGAGRLATDGHLPGVAAEVGDVVVDPLQRGDLVADAVVLRSGEGGVEVAELHEAEHAEPVVDGHDDDVTLPSERGAVVGVAGTGGVGAAVDPEEHRAAGPVRRRGVDVEEEAVLVPNDVARRQGARRGPGDLGRRGAETGGVVDAVPPADGYRWREAASPGGWLGVADAEELVDAVAFPAPDRAERGVDRGHRGAPVGSSAKRPIWMSSTP